MGTQTLGRVAMIARGAYNASTQYDTLDVVRHNGSSYVVLKPVKGVTPAEGSYYKLMAQRGDDGKDSYTNAVESGYGGSEEEFGKVLANAANAYEVSDLLYHNLVLRAESVEEINGLFVEWWKFNEPAVLTRAELMQRWFGNVLYDDRVHGVKCPLFATSTASAGELTDDSAGLSCTPSTASTAGKDDFAHLPQFWTLEVSMERHADGTHEIIKVEHIDNLADVRSGKHGLCQVLQKNTWVREWKDASYHYMQMCCDPADKTGWHTWPQGTAKDGTVYSYIANPKYYAGVGSDGIYTCGTGLAPCNYTSHNTGVTNWRKRGPQYSGVAGNLLKWQMAMIWLKYGNKGNSNIIEGCSSYNYQYTAAVSETGVERVVLTTAQAANMLAGGNVIIGDKGTGTSIDRNTASMYKICRNKRIKSIESVTINGTTYSAVNIDNGGVKFDTVAGTTYISTMPWWSGRNDDVKGFDGSRTSYTNGKEPGLIQRTEFMNGSYLILSDELWQWGKDASGNFTFDCYVCHDQSKVTTNGSISGDYAKQSDLTLTFPSGTAEGWQYIEDIAIANDPGIIWPAKVSTAAGTGTGVKDGMYVAPASSGVRAAWCVCYLNIGGNAGLAARISNSGTPYSAWGGSVGCPSGISG